MLAFQEEAGTAYTAIALSVALEQSQGALPSPMDERGKRTQRYGCQDANLASSNQTIIYLVSREVQVHEGSMYA